MKLIGQESEEFGLEVLGYEFPHIATHEWDSEWLIVAGHVSCGRGRWKFRDPCLCTFELAALAAWLERLQTGTAESELDFTEPNLRFQYLEDGAGGAVSVAFSQEAAPPWMTPDERYGDGFSLIFPRSSNDFMAASAALRDMLLEWPVRTRKGSTG